MVFGYVFYGIFLQIHGILVISILADQCRSIQTHVPEVVIDTKIVIHRFVFNQGLSNGHYILINCLKV